MLLGQAAQSVCFDDNARELVQYISARAAYDRVIESGINYGRPFGRHHHADLLTTIARLAGANVPSFGLPVNNYMPIVLT